MAQQILAQQIRTLLVIAILIGAPAAFPETHAVWKGADLEAQASRTRGSLALHSGAGYTIQLKTIDRGERSASGEPDDQMLWIRRGVGQLSLGLPPRQSEIAVGDVVRIPRGTAFAIDPRERLDLIAVRVKPLAAGVQAPDGIRPTRGKMGDVVKKKAEIDATILRTEANAPLHAQDNFTVNYVLFKKGRVGPWESHAGCVDIYLVQTGAGVIQLGGAIENAKEESPGEPRGTGVTGSQENAVDAGSLVVIPRNVAHHMNPKSLPLAYVLIKVWSK